MTFWMNFTERRQRPNCFLRCFLFDFNWHDRAGRGLRTYCIYQYMLSTANNRHGTSTIQLIISVITSLWFNNAIDCDTNTLCNHFSRAKRSTDKSYALRVQFLFYRRKGQQVLYKMGVFRTSLPIRIHGILIHVIELQISRSGE